MKVLGIDISLNHAGFVMLNDEAKVVGFRFVTDAVGAVKHSPKYGTLIKKPAVDDKGAASIARLQWWDDHLRQLMDGLKPTHVGIEDYAIRAEGNAVYQIGEQGGLARLHALRVGACLRLHDPLSVKMFGALTGNATPVDLADALPEQFGVSFAALNPPPAKGKPQNRNVEFDLTSAYVVARLVHTEALLRAGKLDLSSLPDKRIQVFNRVTKTYPTNILSREWITKAA